MSAAYAPERPRIGSLCTGYGGLDIAVAEAFNAEVAWHCQYDPDDKHQYAARILAHHWPDIPNHGDITTVDYTAVEPVDILTAGFPCQDLSLAGKREGLQGDVIIPAGAMTCGECRWGDHDAATCEAAAPSGRVPARLTGPEAAQAVAELNARDLADPAGPPPERVIKGNRSGLWQHVLRAIRTLRPKLVVIENVRGILSSPARTDVEPCPYCMGDAGKKPALRALGAVLGDLASVGFDAEWCGIRASDVGAPHERFREFILAWPRTAEDADSTARGERRLAAPGEEEGRGTRPHPGGRGGAPAARRSGHPAPAHPACIGRETPGLPLGEGQALADAGVGAEPPAHPDRPGLEVREDEHDGHELPAAERGDDRPHLTPVTGAPAPAHPARVGRPEGRPESARLEGRPDPALGSGQDWGPYEPAIRRWEAVVGRPAPRAVDDRGRLSPAFVEWMMGLEAGHVTGVPGLPRNAQLKALGNGVVPQQAYAAIHILYARAFGLAA